MNSVWIYLVVSGCTVHVVFGVSKDCTVIGHELSECTDTYQLEPMLIKGIPFFTNATEFYVFCSHVDELLSCFRGIFGHCSVTFYDYEAYSATFHEICRNITFAISAFDGCIDQTNNLIDTCMKKYRRETLQLYRDLAGKSLNTTGQCGLYSSLRKCLVWNITTVCLPEYSSFLTSVFQRRFTPTVCKGIYYSKNYDNQEQPKNTATHIFNENIVVWIVSLLIGVYVFAPSRLNQVILTELNVKR